MRYKNYLRWALAVAVVAWCFPGAAGAYDLSLKWKTISTEHFDVHFHEGEEWTAEQVATIAEEIYPHITGLYHYEPDRCHFVILDTQDYANGAAFFYDNKIEIWATNLEFGYRGTTQWLRNVVTHEYTHIVSIQSAMKFPLRIPAIYFQAIGFENEKRPDVINGYPDLIASYPISGFIVPPWWAEGVAQFQSPSMRNDCWDTHRDMILRSSLLGGTMLTYDEMSFFGHAKGGNEKVYDHGYGLVRFIGQEYGPDAVREISESLARVNRLTIDGAIKHVTGKSGRDVYKDWKAWLEQRFDAELVTVRGNERAGRIIDAEGFMTTYPSMSPDGERIAYLSNPGSDYAATGLYICDTDGKNRKRLRGRASSRPVFSPDGKKLLFASHEHAGAEGAMKSDLFEYDFETQKEKRLTEQMRAAQPQYGPGGKGIVCVVNGDGTNEIVLLDANGKNPRTIVAGGKGMQYYSPQYSPDGKQVLFGVFDRGTRDVATVNADGSNFSWVLRTPNDERDARWAPDGRHIVFSSDRTGIFNIYELDVSTGRVTQLSNVVGGAFAPDAAGNGLVAYSGYDENGYHLAVLEAPSNTLPEMAMTEYATRDAQFDECTALKIRPDDVGVMWDTSGDAVATDEGDAVPDAATVTGADPSSGTGTTTAYSAEDAKGYRPHFTQFQFYPRVVIWDGVPRFGAFMALGEVLDRQNAFVAGSYGTDGAYDLLIDATWRVPGLKPALFASYFKVRQPYDDVVTDEQTLRQYFLDVRYDLWLLEAGLRFEWADPYSLTHRHNLSLSYTHSEYRVFIDPTYRDATDPPSTRTPDFDVGWRYYEGREFYLRYNFRAVGRAVDSDINPRGGRSLALQIMYARDRLFTSGEFEYAFNPKLTDNFYGMYTLNYHEYLRLPWWRHSIDVHLLGAFIDNKVDDFFWYYLGGLDGLRGYTYYSIGGRAAALAGATYRFPILRRINKQVSFLTFKDLYGGVFFETGNAWDHDRFETDSYKRSVGFDARLNMGSFYAYPLAINVVGAYSLDEVRYINPLAYVNADLGYEPVIYKPAWSYYTTIGFSF